MRDHQIRPDAGTVRSVEAFLYFVNEREQVRRNRESGLPAPWTHDPVLQKYKFTNVRRQNDRVSKWVIEHLITPAVEDGDEHLWFTLLIARLVNWPPTLQKLLDAGVIPCSPAAFEASKFVEVLEACKLGKTKVYSGAYMLYPTRMEPGGTKSSAVAKYIIGSAVQNSQAVWDSLWGHDEHNIERFVATLSQCFGISTFIAGQVAADLTYTGLDFEDLYTYAPLGPGSQQGLNFIYGRSRYARWGADEFNTTLQGLDRLIESKLGIRDLTLHDVQNCACEFSKYARSVLGEGAPKSTYKPETEF